MTRTTAEEPGDERPGAAGRNEIEKVLGTVKEHVWLVPLAAAVAAALTYGLILRYYDTAYAAAGWRGLSLSVDQRSAIARAFLGGLLLVADGPLTYLLFRAIRDEKTSTAETVLLSLLPPGMFVLGIALGLESRGEPVTLGLSVSAVFTFLAVPPGLLARWRRSRRTQRGRSGRPTGPRMTISPSVVAAFVVILGIVTAYAVINTVDSSARGAVASLRRGGVQDDPDSIVAPLDMRLVRIAWMRPDIASAYQPLLDGPLLLVARRDGRAMLVEAAPPKGQPPREIDVPDDAVSLREPCPAPATRGPC